MTDTISTAPASEQQPTELNIPWKLHFTRDGTEDIAVIADADGEVLAASRHFWRPEGDDSTPPTLAAMRVMNAAPKLLETLQIVLATATDEQLLAIECDMIREAIAEATDDSIGRVGVSTVPEAKSDTTQNLPPKKLPSDPEGMNDDRAAWADHALQAFQTTTGTDREDALSDLLGDLMHLCDRDEELGSFEAQLERAKNHYEAETAGEVAV